jgi:hypothetical protein
MRTESGAFENLTNTERAIALKNVRKRRPRLI